MDKMYNLREVSALLGIKVRTVRQWVYDGKLNAIKYQDSRRWFVSESELKRITKGEI